MLHSKIETWPREMRDGAPAVYRLRVNSFRERATANSSNGLARVLRANRPTAKWRDDFADYSKSAREHAQATRTSFGPQSGPTLNLARLFIVFATPHFFLDATPLNELAEAADRLLNRLAVPNDQPNHYASFTTRLSNVNRPT